MDAAEKFYYDYLWLDIWSKLFKYVKLRLTLLSITCAAAALAPQKDLLCNSFDPAKHQLLKCVMNI